MFKSKQASFPGRQYGKMSTGGQVRHDTSWYMAKPPADARNCGKMKNARKGKDTL
jgi:hypothetical protein